MTMTLNDKCVSITNFYENLNGDAILNATNSFVVASDSVFPDVADLEGLALTTCVITNDDGVRIPTQGLYKKVDGLTVTYDDRDKVYTLNIILA